MNKTIQKPKKKVTVAEVLTELRTFPKAYKLILVCDLHATRDIGGCGRAMRVGGVVAVSYHQMALEGLRSRLHRMTKPDLGNLLVRLGFVSAATFAELPILRVDEMAIRPADDAMDGPL